MYLIRAVFKHFYLFGLLLFAQQVFAAVPVQEGVLRGAEAAAARLTLISSAESFLGTPYRYSGIDRSGIDCSGLVYASFLEAFGIMIPRSSDGIYDWAEKISTNELQPGDLVFFITSGPYVSHLGIYTGGGNFIHSASEGPQTGVMYSNLNESYWKRTYYGAGRALPWDAEAARTMGGGQAGSYGPAALADDSGASDSGAVDTKAGDSGKNEKVRALWAEPGFFTGVGVAWNWGGFIQGSDSVFRGLSFQGIIGYKWMKFRLGLELRPGFDRSLGVFRLPITLSLGNNYFQFFGGPAVTLGSPSLSLSDGEREYIGKGKWRWELGASASLPFIKIKSGALAIYGEVAWQRYPRGEDEGDFSFKPDFTANFRLSTGFRYLWHL